MLQRVVLTIVANAAGLAVAAWIFDGIRIGAPRDDLSDKVITFALVAAILGTVNAIVAPLAKLLSLPLIIVTLGLFLLVVNALMLMLTREIAQALELSFRVNGFWVAVGGALVISLVTMVVNTATDRE